MRVKFGFFEKIVFIINNLSSKISYSGNSYPFPMDYVVFVLS